MSPALVAIVLWVLASLDAAFVGFRDAAGRNPRVHKRQFFARAMAMGLGWGQVASLLGLLWLGAVVGSAADPGAALADQVALAEGMIGIYGAYAAVVLGALLVYAVPHPDVSSLATVLVLGPLTLGRPAVIGVGALWGFVDCPTWRTGLSALLAAGMMLALEPLLGMRWRDRDPLEDPSSTP